MKMKRVADYTFDLRERKEGSRKGAKTQRKRLNITLPTFAPLLLCAKILSIVLCATLIFGSLGNARADGDMLLSQPLTVRWRYESAVTLNLTPAFDSERIYLPLAGGTIVALKAKDGQLFWRAEMGGELSASPVADENAIYVA